jgi:hypothetical protein
LLMERSPKLGAGGELRLECRALAQVRFDPNTPTCISTICLAMASPRPVPSSGRNWVLLDKGSYFRGGVVDRHDA